MMHDEWAPITDLPDNWRELALPELSTLARVWTEQRDRLKVSQSVKEFNERLRREWSIETGILERLYTIDRGITQLLIEQGIDASLIPHGATDRPAGEVVAILEDHHEALEGIFDFVAGRRPLTLSYIRQLHQVLTRHQEQVEGLDQFGKSMNAPLLRGEWKKWPNNPTRPDGSAHEYCPPLQVAGEMERLLEFHHRHHEVPPEVEAAWLHHRFTQIHPFQDGNGRVARALATLVFLKAGWFPLVINRDQRKDYISALEAADQDNLRPLIKLFDRIAKWAFIRALTLSENVLRNEEIKSVPQLVADALQAYKARPQATDESQQVEALGKLLSIESLAVLENVAKEITQQFSRTDFLASASADISNEDNIHFYTRQILAVAESLDYKANVARQRYWTRLNLNDGQKAHIVFSFHFLGEAQRGLMACAGFIYFPAARTADDADGLYGEFDKICQEPFTFTHLDRAEFQNLRDRFHKWHTAAIRAGLESWTNRL